MFNIGAGEILLVLVVAFVIVGPDDLPKVARWLGRMVRKLRTLIRDIKAETGWDEVEKEVREVQKDVKQTVREMDISADLKDAVKDVNQEINGISKDMKADFRELDRQTKADMKSLDDDIRAATARAEDADDTQ
ncbi:MAG: twin-arginine translocase subunit TatB [Clostridia bacterium]|nr:twin-arginine translocase subunit TatB [Clostridia bacterium]